MSGEEPQQPRDITMAVFKNMIIRRMPIVSHEILRGYCQWAGGHGTVDGSGTMRRRGTATASALAPARHLLNVHRRADRSQCLPSTWGT